MSPVILTHRMDYQSFSRQIVALLLLLLMSHRSLEDLGMVIGQGSIHRALALCSLTSKDGDQILKIYSAY